MRYLAFLRAVNVGGRTVKMDRLRTVLADAGFENVATFIQSGNVFFDSAERSTAKLTERIEGCLAAELGFEVPAIVRTVKQLEAVVALDPFADVEVTDDIRLLMVFLAGPPAKVVLPLCSPKGDYEVIGLTKGEAFVVVRLINGKWGSATWPERALAVPGTGRFWHTTLKILDAARA